ncbi:DUF5810 domain-containing protein [Haloarcula salinisoli]|uniref:Uncharacterized protein n=1 Tax=Haloarcula salinisoli TaxID=2487746 RepID=A0A8J7YMF6_9EURY|nr:DUF5810 domain-containing protein [Halomicroarcula salinisoli]MBX0287158.1 hypothetical protein [Halomicroarcula salinisoli]MBX0304461.1 hypothetical protein [Halomicroarcula salinisoli]
MGYACPVCSDPQADATHLANHLAFTALTGGDDHEAWLDDHVPEWGQFGETELAEHVVDHAEEREFPQVFEESGTGEHAPDDLPSGADSHRGAASVSDEDAEVLAEARELTKEMLEAEDEDAGEDETQ